MDDKKLDKIMQDYLSTTVKGKDADFGKIDAKSFTKKSNTFNSKTFICIATILVAVIAVISIVLPIALKGNSGAEDKMFFADDGTYDVYKDNTLIAENVSWCDLYKDSTYLFIKRQLGGKIKVYIDGETLQYGDNNVVSSYLSVYVLNLEEMIRLDITSIGRGDIEVYDAALNKVELDHGYLLKAGRHYIILSVPGNSIITVKEYLQEVNITFYVDGNIYNDATGTKYYYGKKAR